MKYSALALLASFLILPSACGSPVSTGDGDGDDGNIDKDGDKVADHLGQSLDKDMDGVADCFDINDDGVEECVGVDTDGDGELDAIGFDTDGDGIVDALDTTGDGVPDVTGTGGAGNTGGGSGTGGGGPGAGGGGPGAGGGPTGDGVGCEGAEFCDDFEDGIADGWTVQPQSTPAPVADTTKANTGTGAMKAVNGSQGSFLTYPVPAQKFYARAYMNFGKSTDTMTGHSWYIVAADNITQGKETQVRFGSSSNHSHPELDMNLYANTCGGEKTQFSDGASDGAAGWEGAFTDSVNLAADTWYCIEVMFDAPAHEAKVWLNGNELSGLHVHAGSMCEGWSPAFTHVKFGAGSNGDATEIWYDDVAVATQPIGCSD